jgi:hypothetical protein
MSRSPSTIEQSDVERVLNAAKAAGILVLRVEADQARASPIIESSDYLTEDEILARWPKLTQTELRRARKSNPPEIAFYDFPGRSGGPCCTAAQVQEYIDRTYLRTPQCQTASPDPAESDSKSASTISNKPIPTEAAPGTLAGMTPELAKSVAEAYANEILNRPKSSSRGSSPRPRRQKTAHLALIKS